jgi:serine protease Do
VSRGWLGVTIQNVTEDIAESLGLETPKGAMVAKLTPNGPAAESGIEVGDTIVEVNGDEIRDSRDLARKVASLEPNKTARITVFRDGRELDVAVRLGLFPDRQKLAKLEDGQPLGTDLEILGLTIAPAKEESGLSKDGVVITEVNPKSGAADKGLKAGDVILEIGGQIVSKPDDVEQGVKSAKDKGRKAVLLRIRSGEEQRFIALPLKVS